MLTVALGLAAAFLYAFTDFLMVRIVRSMPVSTALVWLVSAGVVVIVPLALMIDGVPAGEAAWRGLCIAALGGIAYMAALGALFRGLAVGRLSLVSPLNALEGAFAAAVAIALGGWIGGWTAIGLPLAVIGGVLAATERRGREKATADSNRQGAAGRWAAARGTGWGLLAAVAGGVTILLYGWASGVPPLTAVAASRVVSLVIVIAVASIKGELRLPAGLRPRVVVIGLLEAAAFVALAAATARGPVAVAAVTTAQFATFAVVLGVIVLKERPALLQSVGIAVTLVAVSVLALS